MRFKIGSTYTLGYGIGKVKIEKPTAKGKTFKAVRESDGKSIHFGDADMPTRQDNPKAKASYCARADGLAERGFNPNTFSLIYWDCIPANPKSGSNMKIKRRIITNTSKSSVTKADGQYIINAIPITVDNGIMNNIKYPADENEKGMPSMVGKPMSLTHPSDSTGRNVSIFSPEGIDFYSGGKVTHTYNKDGVWYANASIDEKKLKSSDEGEYFANRLDAGEPIGVSTGLTFERNNESGDGYDMVARNMDFDHLAMLHESERPAGGDATVMRFNGEEVEAFNFEDFAVGSSEPQINQEHKGLFNKFMAWLGSHGEFADGQQLGYNNTDLNTNGDRKMRNLIEAKLKAAGIEVNGLDEEQLLAAYNAEMSKSKSKKMDDDEDDEEETNMKGKKKGEQYNSEEMPEWFKPVLDKVNALETAVNAKAESELEAKAAEVEALNIGITKDAAKAMGLDACNAVIATNSSTSAASFSGFDRSTHVNTESLLDSEMPE